MINRVSKSFFINLDRRTDRLDHIHKTLPFYAERFSAVDAKDLTLTEEIKKLFPEKYHQLTKAEIACALSHYRLWKQLTQDKNSNNYLILEDDVVFEDGFLELWNNKFSQDLPKNFMIAYLGGCQPWNKTHYHNVLEYKNNHFFTVKKNDFFTPNDYYWHMNASSYIVSKQAASLLCQWVEQFGFNAAFDVFIIKFLTTNKLFSAPDRILHLNPLMARQIHEANGNIEADKKSDLRFCNDRFEKEEKQKLKLIWQVDPNNLKQTYETDWIREIFSELDLEEIIDTEFKVVSDDSIIVYTDIWPASKKGGDQDALYLYLDKAAKQNNVSIVHLGDEYTHARTDHYENFRNTFRTTYNESVSHMKNVTQIPLGYKRGFHD